MLAHGNGDAEITSQNLVKTVRGEVPYDRIKGVDSSFTDRPINDIKTDIENDVIETLEEYKKSIIFQTICHGINGDIQMKRTDSDVWSEIPVN